MKSFSHPVLKTLTAGLVACGLLVSASAMARVVTDDNGDSVNVADSVKRVVVTNVFPMASAVTVFTGSGNTVVGMHPASMSAAKAGTLGTLYPDVLKAKTDFVAGGNVNVEALSALHPDVVLVQANDKKQLEALRAAGLPAFAVSPTKYGFNVLKTYEHWMGDMAQLWPNLKDKSAKIIAESAKIEQLVSERVAKIPANERRRALVVFRADPKTLIVSGKKFFGQYWISKAGGINVAQEVEAPASSAVVSMEQVHQWNPDVIFITNFTGATPQTLASGQADGRDWKDIKAVKEGQVYKMPLGIYRSFTPSADSPLTLLWVAKTLYPAAFKDVDMAAKVKAYYHDVYGVDLTNADVERMFNPGTAGAQGTNVKVQVK